MNTSIVPVNRLRARLADGATVTGTMLTEWRDGVVMQLLANAGLDFVIIDNEHGQFPVNVLSELSRTAVLVGLTPIVRVPELSYAHVVQPLDGGAQGIMLPRVTEPAQVRQCLEWLKYPPAGQRGSVLGRAHTGFRVGDVATMMADANRESMLVMQVETREALERLEELVAIPGVDAALIGPNDLSIALGVPGQLSAPVMEAAIDRTIACCGAAGVVPAVHTNDAALAQRWRGRGMRLVSVSSEAGALMKGMADARAKVLSDL